MAGDIVQVGLTNRKIYSMYLFYNNIEVFLGHIGNQFNQIFIKYYLTSIKAVV